MSTWRSRTPYYCQVATDHNMSDHRQTRQRFPSAISSPLQDLRNRPPSPNNRVQPGVASIGVSSDALIFPEPIADSPSLLPLIESVNESPNQRLDQNTPNPQRSMTMISAEQLNITGGNFIQTINNRDDNILNHSSFQSLLRSSDAAFNAAINVDNLARRRCTKGTRVDIIDQIMAWVKEEDALKAPPVYWLTGLAGLGKTTIAFTICELLHEARLPFASFFCSLQLNSSDSKLLVPTLCRELAEIYESYATNLQLVLVTNSKAVHANLRFQIDELLAGPWNASIAQRNDCGITPIVVVDALDENDRGIDFLKELLRVIDAGELVGIKFLVTSRTVPEIVDICESFSPKVVCKLHDVDRADVQNDIEKYLREALPQLKDKPELASLSQRAGGFFIYATTAVRFISPPQSKLAVSEMYSLLQEVLSSELLSTDADSDEHLLVDELYERILGDAFRDKRFRVKRLQVLHTIVCSESGIDMSALANLADTTLDVVERVVKSLHAVLFVSPKGCVYWYHASFPDFVFSEARAKFNLPPLRNHSTHQPVDVFCNESAHNGFLARRCFSIMQASLYFNMCSLPSSYLFDSEVPGLTDSVNKAITPTLRYVSRHWARHLRRAVPAKNDTDELYCGLKDFLLNKLLFWIEAMNLMGFKYECSSLLNDAESWLTKSQGIEWPILLKQLKDATNFSTVFAGSAASKSTPHLYISALAVRNHNLPIWRTWRNRFRCIPSILQASDAIIPLHISTNGRVGCIAFSPDGNRIIGSVGRSVQLWDANTGKHLSELKGHTGWVRSATFSPDGNKIVSGSGDVSVRVWDARTGKQLRELQGHTDCVLSVTFSSDGNRIISGSKDKSIRLWVVESGEQLTELQGHTRSVRSVAFSSDGNQIVSGSDDKSVRVWNAETGEQSKTLGHPNAVDSVACSRDNQIVSGSWDGSVRVWDIITGEQLMVLQGHSSWVRSVAFSPDGNRIVSGSYDFSVRLWDAKTGKQLRELPGHTFPVTSVAFSPDGDRIVSGSEDQSVRIWDARAGEHSRKPQGHNDSILSVAFSPDGNQIVSGSSDKSVRIWDAVTGKQLSELQGHTRSVMSVAFSPDGDRIVSGSNESVRVWNAETGEQLRVLPTNQVTSFAFSPDHNRIVLCYSDKSVQVCDTETGEQLRELQGHTHSVSSVAFSPDGKRIVLGSHHESMRVWDAETGEQLTELQGHIGLVTSVAYSAGGNRIVSGSDDDTARVWDAETGEQLRELQGQTSCIISVAFSPDGNQIVSGSFDKSVRVWNAETGEQLIKLQGHISPVTSVAYSPGGNRIVSSSHNDTVRIWDADTGEQLRELQGQTSCITSVAFSPDGNQIVSGSDDSAWVWDAETGKQLMELRGHSHEVSFSPDGNRIISGSFDKSVRVWDAKTGKQLRELEGDIDEVGSVAFSPNGNRIVGSFNNSVRVWDAETGEQLREMRGHTLRVTSFALSHDGSQIVSGSKDKSVRVWNLETGEQLKKLQGHTLSVNSVAFSPHDNRIVSGSQDFSIRVWDVETGEQLRVLKGRSVESTSFLPDGNHWQIISGSSSLDDSMRVWNAETGEYLRELRGHTARVTSVAVSPDGNRIVSGSMDKSMRVWDNVKLDAPWVVNEDGWILSGAERLVWLPLTICNVLLRPPNTLIISRNGSATISFSQCKFGVDWRECYTP